MRLFDKLKLRVRSLRKRDQMEREMGAELRFHLDELIRENLSAGMPATEARQAALRTMGGVAQFEEQIRDTRRMQLIETLGSDIRYAFRALRRAPVFATVAILSLALGTGANTAIFSLIDTVLLQRLPVPNPDELVIIRTSSVKVGNFNVSRTLTNGNVAHLTRATGLQGLATVRDEARLNVGVGGSSEVAPGQFVSPNYFAVLGIEPALGRNLGTSDDRPTADGWPLTISYGYWQRRFGASPSVLGTKITINTIPCVIVGVLPRRFNGLWIDDITDISLPIAVLPQVRDGKVSAKAFGPEDFAGTIFARRKPDVTVQSLQAEMTVLLQQGLAEKNQGKEEDKKLSIVLTPAANGMSGLRRQFESSLRVLMAVVAIVMLIASANIASLLLTRAASRQREICIRMSMGSSRWRLVRQLFTESMVLSVLGSALGLGFALWARAAIVKVAITQASQAAAVSLQWNWHLFAFTTLLCLLNAVFFGTAPALKATRVDANLVLHSGRAVRTSGVRRVGKWLVGGQVALSLALLVGAALLLRTLSNFYKVNLGYNHQNVLLMTVDPHLAGYADGEQSVSLMRQMRERIAAVPGVQAVSMMREPLLGGSTGLTSIYVPGYLPTEQERSSQMWIVNEGVGPHFFSTVQMPIIAGRDFGEDTVDRYGKVAIINQTMAKHFFAGKNPIGEKVAFAKDSPLMEIIGVAGEAHYFGVQEETQEVIFVPLLHPEMKQKQATLLIRTAGDPRRLATEIRAVVRSLDANLPVYNVTTLSEMVDDNLAHQRLLALLSGFFGGLALVLSAIGLYGVLAYGVAQRTGEIGVRMALGATRRTILRLVLGETAQVVGAGILAGLAITVACAKLIRTVLYGVTPTDTRAMAIAVAILTLVALAAAFVPMRRAVRVDPMTALRDE